MEQVDIYEQEQPDGRFLKHIKFRFPVYFGDRETQELCWDNESTVETVCCLQKIWEKPKGHLLPEFLEKECPFLIFFDFIYLIRAFTRNIPSIINVVNGQFRSQSGRLCKISSDQNNDGRSLCNRIWNLSGVLIFWCGWSISTAMKSSGIRQGIFQGILQGIFQGMPFGTFCRSYIDGKKTQRYNKKKFTVFLLLKWRERMKYKRMRKNDNQIRI